VCSNYYLPFFGLFVGIGTVLITLFAIKLMVADKLNTDSLFKEQMDSMVQGFKEQVPIANSFISDTLMEKLKEIGLIEVAKLTPKIKQQINSQILHASLILVVIGALFGFFMGLLVWWICAR
jgi:hypothetical protein